MQLSKDLRERLDGIVQRATKETGVQVSAWSLHVNLKVHVAAKAVAERGNILGEECRVGDNGQIGFEQVLMIS